MDVLFGTYVCPDHEPASFGIEEPIAKRYLGQMLHPFLPAKGVESAPPQSTTGEALLSARRSL
jgi:hypothetical protein